MGHYASEMMCSTCGRTRCVCPPPVNSEKYKWLVDNDCSTVMTVEEHDEKYKYIQSNTGFVFDGMPVMRRMGKQLYDTKEEALNSREALLDIKIEGVKRQMARLEVDLELLEMKKEQLK